VRILHIATRHRLGGAERNLTFSVDWEVEHGHEVHVAIGRDSLLDQVPPAATIHVIRDLVREVSPLRDLRAYRALRKLITAGDFDLVHTHQSKAGVLGRLAARGTGRNVVHTIHMASFGRAYNPVASAVFLRAERFCARWTTRIVSVGRELASMYQQAGIGRSSQYTVIRSPIDLDEFFQARLVTPDVKRRRKADLGFEHTVPLAVVVSSLEPRKRVDRVMRELADLVRDERLQLAIAGDGAMREQLASFASKAGISTRARLLGYVNDIPNLMSAADLLVHAATVEGVPQVVIQAWAAGVPVVATQMPGLREIDRPPLLIAGSRPGDLAAAVLRQLAAPGTILPTEAFEPWSRSGVEAALARIHDDLGAVSA